MKNFKRVISAVIALALSASTLVAVSASKFSDVDNANANAEAINALAALDIIHGYDEEGGLVFKPEGEITRAEAAVMIVGALNMNADAKAAAGTSKFTDVNEQTSWASGYVNVGVAQGYINGMDDTTFAPQQNVNYAQMCTMLTLITGYGDYAAANGGYPTGYMAMASSAGINKGVALSADTPLKRGQVAQMLYNAVTAPVLGITEYKLDGNTYAKLDGAKQAKKTVLSDKFDAIEIRATVSAIPTGAAGKVNLALVDNEGYGGTFPSENWSKFTSNGWNGIIVDNDMDLSGYLQQEIKAILQLDENGRTHLVHFTGTSAVETKEVAAAEAYTVNAVDSTIKFGTQKENFTFPVLAYVNGALYTAGATGAVGTDAAYNAADANLVNILKNATGTIKLAKVNNANNYNAIFVDAYQIEQVTSVSYEAGATTVSFRRIGSNNLGAALEEIKITDNEIETGAVKLNVTLDGEAIELKDLKKNDIIAIKTNISPTATSITASANSNITILVSRDTISGKVTEKDTEDANANKYTIGGTDYAAVDKTNIGLQLSKVYNVVYLDPFGRLAAYNDEEIEETKSYAIVAKIDDPEVTLILPDGTSKIYEVKGNDAYPTAVYTVDGTITLATSVVAAANQHANTSALDCVVEYTLKGGKISAMTYATAASKLASAGTVAAPTKAEYKEDVLKIGAISVNSATNIIDVSEGLTGTAYKKYSGKKVSQLANSEKYAGVGYGKISGTTIYSLVLLTDSGYTYSASSRFAVADAINWSEGTDADGEAVKQLKVVVNGEKKALNLADKVSINGAAAAAITVDSPTGHGRGAAFFYDTDSDGLVSLIDWIDVADIKAAGDFAVTTTGTAPNTKDYITKLRVGTHDPDKWGKTLINGNDDYRLVRGIVVGVSDSKVKIMNTPAAADDDTPVDTTNYELLTLADNCLVYTYNTKTTIDIEDSDRVKANGSLVASDFADWKITGDTTQTGYNGATDAGKIAWTSTTVVPAGTAAAETWATARGIKSTNGSSIKGKTTEKAAQYAMALVIDGQVVEIYEIIQ